MAGWKSGFSKDGSEAKPNAASAAAVAERPAFKPVEEKSGPVTVVVDGRTLVEREAPELFKFEGVGDFVKGVLMAMDIVTVREKRTVQFTIYDAGDGKTRKILGTYDLLQKINKDDVGRFVQIVYKGENKEIRKGDNFLRIFSVAFEDKKKTAATFEDGTQITDADIPF
jgi:hypothetical protein